MPHTQHSSTLQPPPHIKPEMGSGAANSLTIIINFMHILCKPLVHRQDGIDLIRISIIEPFGRQLLIREQKAPKGLGGLQGLLRPQPYWLPSWKWGAGTQKRPHHGADNQPFCFPINATGVTQQHMRGCSSGQAAMCSHPANPPPSPQHSPHRVCTCPTFPASEAIVHSAPAQRAAILPRVNYSCCASPLC